MPVGGVESMYRLEERRTGCRVEDSQRVMPLALESFAMNGTETRCETGVTSCVFMACLVHDQDPDTTSDAGRLLVTCILNQAVRPFATAMHAPK